MSDSMISSYIDPAMEYAYSPAAQCGATNGYFLVATNVVAFCLADIISRKLTSCLTSKRGLGCLKYFISNKKISNLTSCFISNRGGVRSCRLVLAPKSFRDRCRACGLQAAYINTQITVLVSLVVYRTLFLPTPEDFVNEVLIGPAFEEIKYRGPLLLTSSTIDDHLGVMSARVTKVALALICSIAFAYAHDAEPSTRQLVRLVASGLMLSYLSLNSSLSSQVEIFTCLAIAHMINNFCGKIVEQVNKCTRQAQGI